MSREKQTLLDPAFLRKLERLRIQARRAFPGTMRGERRSTRRGASVEFADFRKYEAGDDFRHVDWNIYARLERLMLRQFVEEEDVRIDILLDQSRSMHFGRPRTKFDSARKAAAALAFLAVGSLDRVGVAAFDSAVRSRMRAMRGRGHLVSVLTFLEGLSDNQERPAAYESVSKTSEDDASLDTVRTGAREPGGPPTQSAQAASPAAHTDLSSVLRSYQKASPRPGVLFMISDFMDAGGFRQEMKLLAHRGFDVNLIQVLAAEEVEPEVGGDLLLVDSETGEAREITANERVVAAYKAALAEYTTSLESFARANGIGYTMFATDASFEDMLLKNLIESRMAE
ncbi:MAG: DUF58 domain-containing protein [Blastocatellia bacterium]